ARAPEVAWTDEGFAVTPMRLVASSDPSQRIEIGGTWRRDGKGALRVTATHVFLETLQGAFQQPARYGGVLDADATIAGTPDRPTAIGQLTIQKGRIRAFSYERLSSRVEFADEVFCIDARLEQAPGTWLTAKGDVPLAVFDRRRAERDIDVAIAS